VDVVLDLVGGNAMEQSYNVLKPSGRYVTTLVMQPPQDEAERRGIHSFGFGAQSKAELLTKFAELIDNDKLQVFINRTFPLEQAQGAMEFRARRLFLAKLFLILFPEIRNRIAHFASSKTAKDMNRWRLCFP